MGDGQPLAIRRKKNRLMLVFSMVRLTANNGSFTQYKAKKMGYGINRNPFLCLSNKDPARNTAGLSCSSTYDPVLLSGDHAYLEDASNTLCASSNFLV